MVTCIMTCFIPEILFSKDAFMLSSESTIVGTQIIEEILVRSR